MIYVRDKNVVSDDQHKDDAEEQEHKLFGKSGAASSAEPEPEAGGDSRPGGSITAIILAEKRIGAPDVILECKECHRYNNTNLLTCECGADLG
eukprot:4647810-Karenia_brevis.AAC.1